MDIAATQAAQGYLKARPATEPTQGLMKAAEQFTTTLQQGEATATAAMTGGADPHALVQALAASETAIETAVTIRDKVVEAYQEILRMPV